MSVEAMAVALHHAPVTGTAKVVLLGIANHDGDGGAWPSVETLAKYAHVHERNVQKALSTLVAKGLLRIEVQQGGDRDVADSRRPNRYVLLVRCPEWCDRTTQHRDTRRLAGAQLHLLSKLSTGVAHAPPHPRGKGTRGGATATPTGGAAATQTTHGTQPLPSESQPQTREAPCITCGHSEWHCQRQQARWAADERHPYQPQAVRHAKG